MVEKIPCPQCGVSIGYYSSEIGMEKECPKCKTFVILPVPKEAAKAIESNEDARKKARQNYVAKWGKHDHMKDPNPFEDPNGFLEQLQRYCAQQKAEKLAEKFEGVRIITYPPSEDYARLFEVLKKLSPDEWKIFPAKVAESLRALAQAWNFTL